MAAKLLYISSYQAWSLVCNISCNGCRRLFNTITASHHLISLNLIERNEKQLTTNLYTHTPTSATQNTNTHTHTGPCSHRAQYQSESPFTHGPCNTDGLTFLEKVRDLTCSPSTELLDHTEQVWGCCALHLKDCSESETVSDNTRHSGTITFHFEHLFMRWLTLAVLSW